MNILPAIVTGLAYTLCFPKWNFGFLAWAAFVPLLLSLSGQTHRTSFSRAWTAGFIANLCTLAWIYPTCRAGGVGVFVSLLAPAALSAVMALYWGVFGLSLRLWEDRPGLERPFLSASAWTALEYLRTHLLTGFPWLLLGTSQWKSPPLISLSEIGGVYAVSFLIMLANSALALILRDRREISWGKFRRAAPSLALLAGLLCWSLHLHLRPVETSGAPLPTAIVQATIDQYKKWDRAHEEEIAGIYSRLTEEAAVGETRFIVWPETAVPGWLPNDPKWTRWVEGLAQASKTHLLVGAVTRQEGKDYNATFLFSPTGQILYQYRKQHLVPFGEVVPFQPLLSRWISVLGMLGEFAGSNDWTVFKLPWGTFSTNICFESLFPDLIRRFSRQGASAIINMTNDGWFLDTAAPEQHFIASVLRAVENRQWVIHAANTGISGFIDPAGRVVLKSRVGERRLLRADVSFAKGRTFYTRHGDVFAKACFLMLIFIGLLVLWEKAGRSLISLTLFRR